MLQLCDEILLMILKLLYNVSKDFVTHGKKQDLLACCAACRRLRDLGKSSAFAHIAFRHSKEGYARLLEMSRS